MAVLKGLTISVAGTLKYDSTQIKKWVEANGGTYTPTIRKGLTHLVASKHAWRSASDAVQTAVDLQAWVVSWDWLEDSLQAHRRRAEKSYSWEFLEQKRKKSRELERLGARADRKKFEDGCEEARRATGSGMSKNKSTPMPKPKPRSSTRKPRDSLTSYLVNDDPAKAVPFVPAAETLKQKKAQREAAKAAKTARATSQASKTSWSLSNKATSTKSHSPSASSTSHPLTTTTQTPAPENKQAKPPSLKDLYHYYLDATGFEYKILLTRCDLRSNTMQRYQLSILESHTKPNVYCTFIQYYPAAAPNAPGNNAASGGANNVPSTSTSNSGSATAGDLGVMQAIQDFNLSYPSSTTTTTSIGSTPQPQPPPPPYTGPPSHHPEAQRLLALTLDPKTAPAPSPSSTSPSPPTSNIPPDLPYKALLTPLSSPFPTAYLSFRSAFRDLTLLTWEQRFDVDKSLYKRRAQLYDVEPFVYIRPAAGMPVGNVVQVAQSGVGGGLGMVGGSVEMGMGVDGEARREVTYPFLPALHAALGNGVVGSRVVADRREAERQEAERREREDEAQRKAEAAEEEEARLKAGGLGMKKERVNAAKGKRPRYDRPLFNGLWGAPGREREGERGGFGVVKRQRKAWPSETGWV